MHPAELWLCWPAMLTHWDELCHVTLIGSPQLGTDEALSLLAVVNGAQDSDGALHVESCQVLEPGDRGRERR